MTNKIIKTNILFRIMFSDLINMDLFQTFFGLHKLDTDWLSFELILFTYLSF